MCFSLLKSHRNGYLSFASFSEFLANQSEDNSKCLFSTFAYRAYGTLRRTTTSRCASACRGEVGEKREKTKRARERKRREREEEEARAAEEERNFRETAARVRQEL